jgi:hypothetical protein
LITVLLTVFMACAVWAAAALAGARLPAKDLSDKLCYAYSNVKATFTTEGDQVILRNEFGMCDGFSGGWWFPLTSMKAPSLDCRGFGITVRGNGNAPGKAFLFLKTAKGVCYRSKNLNELFKKKEWHDVVLTAEDFIVDPEYAKNNAEAAKALPKKPDWQSFTRIDFSAVNLEASPTIEFKAFYFVLNDAAAK